MKTLITCIIVFILIIIGLSIYLAPDDIAGCDRGPSNQPSCRTVDAIVAVSGGDTLARTAEAVALYKQGWSDTLIFSGAAQDKTGPSNAAVMRQSAIEAGVSEADILIEELSETTKENAARTEELIADRNIESVILVTSSYHQRRAGLEFAKRFDNQINVINHPVATDNQWSFWWWTTPHGWYLATSEFIKIMIFYIGATR